MRKHAFLSLTLLGLLCGCATPDKVMQSYLGRHYSELVANWGPPQQKMPDGQGGEIWSYAQDREFTTPGHANTQTSATVYETGTIRANPYGANYSGNANLYGQSHTTYTPPTTRRWMARRTFFVNGEGVIYRYAWQGR